MVIGVIWSFADKSWNKDRVALIFTFFKIMGVLLAAMHIWRFGPDLFHEHPDLLPFLFNVLAMPLAFLIPFGALFLTFLTNYGLMEFTGTFLQGFMRKVMLTPGRSAVDAVASLVGSYSVSLLITDKLYQEGKYNKRESVIIGIGFATVSATFMIVVANTLGLMEMWNLFFWSTLIITFAVTAITSRIPPISSIPEEYYEGARPNPEVIITSNRFKTAYSSALETAANSENIITSSIQSFVTGFKMTSVIVTTILSVGMVGMLIACFTPVFDIVGYVFYPFARLVQIPEALLVSQALATGIAEMFLPTSFVREASLHARFVVGVSSISAIIFFSAKIPCVLSTKIPVTVLQMVFIWFERVILSILLSGGLGLLLF
jgi:nucleoside recognition membrane protein YjiH